MKQDNNEIWKPVVGYDGLYEVSDLGRVKSLERRVNAPQNGGRLVRERILKSPLNNCGRPEVVLYGKENKKCTLVYILVAEAFLGERPKGNVVRHKDNNSANSHASNLEYGTYKDNINDRIKHGTMRYGEDMHNSKLTNEQVMIIKSTYKAGCSKNGATAQAKKHCVSVSTISAITTGRGWKNLTMEGDE